MNTMFPDSARSGAVRAGLTAWRRALAIMLIALLSPIPALFAFWADASGDWLPDVWVDPASGHVFTLPELNAFSDDIDGDGLSNAQEMAIGTNPFSPDTDGDGISDLLDPLPLSASNLSPANGIVWGAIALDDADGDGTPNFLDDFPYGLSDIQVGSPDTDGDGIPDIIDPAPWDYSNWSSVNGLQWMGDALADADGDGVPNFHDWYPFDASLWDPLQDPDGDGFVKARDPHPADPYNPSPVNGVNWGPDVYGDSDNDGIPNFYDAYPYDSGNGYVPTEPDSDGDGIPDSSDPSPWDYYNYSAANGVSWEWDACGDADGDGISNFYDQFPYDYYNGNVPVSDMDGDGIPDAEDPAPSDPTNLSPINGGLWYTAALADADGDGNPNFTDPWPYDPTNGNLPPEWNSPTADTDGDGIANAQDPALADPLNFSIYNGTSWHAAANGDIDGDGIANFRDEHPYDYYNGGYAGSDSDGDGIVDSQDPYPYDATNGSGGTGGGGDPQPEPDSDGDGRPDSQDPYPNDPYDNADFDQDGIPDVSDPAQADANNLSPINGIEWFGDVRGDADEDGVQNFWDLEPYGPPSVDVDGDGLIDSVDPAPEDFYNSSPHNGAQWQADALGDFDGDGIPNFFDAWPDDRLNGQSDSDMDGIPDPSDPAPGDPMNYSSYNDRNWYGNEVLGDADNDGRLNFFDRHPEDFYDGNPPVTDPDSDGDGLADSADPAKDDPYNYSPVNQMPWPGGSANEDADGDLISNFDDLEPYTKLPEPEPGPSCFCSWPSAPSVSASTFVLLNDNFDELIGPWTPESKRDYQTDKLFGKDAEGNSRIVIEGLMPLAISLPDGYAKGQRSIVIRQSGVGEVRIHAVRGNEEDCVYSNGMAVVLKQGDGWQYWVEGTRAGQVTLEYEFPESGAYLDERRPGGCASSDCRYAYYDWSLAEPPTNKKGELTLQVVQVEIKIVNRDEPTRTWGAGPISSVPLGFTTAYTSPAIPEVPDVKNGDLISWRVLGLGSGSFKWWASGPNGFRKEAPVGTGDEWKLEDPLDWLPGKWRIHCSYIPSGEAVAECEINFDQKLGYRTPDITVIGWIDGTQIDLPTQYVGLAPQHMNRPGSFLPIGMIMDDHARRNGFLVGVAGSGYTIPLSPDGARQYVNAYLIKNSPNAAPPATFTKELSDGRVLVDDKKLEQFRDKATNYRSFHRFQARFELDDNGKIRGTPFIIRSETAVGDTPVDWLPDPKGETGPHDREMNSNGKIARFNPKNGRQHNASLPDGIEQYSQGRISTTGQYGGGNISKKLNNLNVPWIWSVIGFDAQGALSGALPKIEHEMFPVYHLYYNGARLDQHTNSINRTIMEEFIQLGDNP